VRFLESSVVMSVVARKLLRALCDQSGMAMRLSHSNPITLSLMGVSGLGARSGYLLGMAVGLCEGEHLVQIRAWLRYTRDYRTKRSAVRVFTVGA
jgi:hypothetical protein